MEQNNAKERELVREGQAEGGASLVDEQASTNSFEARAKAAAARREEEEKLGKLLGEFGLSSDDDLLLLTSRQFST
jgi:hypothetical protein